MNFAKGIVETYHLTYKHLKTLLKTIPLETPTKIELSPRNEICVTMFDANHCIGAVMFLIQGHGDAILYTGDVRSEMWWVNSLVQNPILLPYTLGDKRLDTIYLDTTFATKSEPYREFPSKADGLCELLQKVERYPKDTKFYIESWTFGYENVWIALSALLGSQIHLDRYRWGIYRSLARTKDLPISVEAPPLLGFKLGNHETPGCLTTDPHIRLHSCERGSGCPVVNNNPNMVRIVPIITRLPNGGEVHEMGIGGGKGDLDQSHELKIDDANTLGALMQLCATRIPNQDELLAVYSLLTSAFGPDRPPDHLDLRADFDNVRLNELVDVLTRIAKEKAATESQGQLPVLAVDHSELALPTTITFPYSRHSSYLELRALVSAFRPRDVYPCTVDESTWTPESSMRSLFGHVCSGNVFAHDKEMMEMYEAKSENQRRQAIDSQTESQSQSQAMTEAFSQDSKGDTHQNDEPTARSQVHQLMDHACITSNSAPKTSNTTTPSRIPPPPDHDTNIEHHFRIPRPLSFVGTISPPKRQRTNHDRSIRLWAYHAAAGLNEECGSWDAFGGLSCVKPAGEEEVELGEDDE
jgi:DNA cross-link repair 1C protein